ncbi:MAG: CocE/NonD family hydrolase [Lachnospiraceae bacterium]
MNTYLQNQTFCHYISGVYQGKFRFGENQLIWDECDTRTRVQLKEIEFTQTRYPSLFDFHQLYNTLNLYTDESWSQDKQVLKNGALYNRYLTFDGIVNGQEVTGQLWAMRGEPPVMDIVTVEGKVAAFIMTGRISQEYLILEGYESVTPHIKYDDNRLSKVEYGINYLGNQWVKTRDDVNLATDVFLPEGAEPGAKFPTIVIRTCYGKAREYGRMTHYVNRGYAFVVQDVRGRSDSDGELVPFYYERDDAYDLFSWIKDQEWSDGAIGMWGASYLGYTATAAATSGHPNLKTVISEVNVGSPFFHDTVRRGGALCSWPLLCWTLAQSVSNRVSMSTFEGEGLDWDKVVTHRPLSDIPNYAIGKQSGPWKIWSEHYRFDEFWAHCDNSLRGDNIKIPMFVLSGWHDGDAIGVQETWSMLTKYDKPGRRIMIGPWPHSLNAFRDCMDMHYGDNAIDYDFDTRQIRWFDHYLKGIENGEETQPRASYYVGGPGENKWHYSNDWNPEECVDQKLYLDSDSGANSLNGNGRLQVNEPKTDTWDSYIYDPENCASTTGEFEPIVLNAQQSRQDHLVYTTKKLLENVAVAGNLSADFYAASSAVDTDFYVRISEVDEQGVAREIAQNMIRAEFRNYPEVVSAPLTPGNVEKYHIGLNFAGHVFAKGNQIRVDISSSDYMVGFPNTNTGIDPFENPKPVIATQTIYHGSKYLSYITLPVLYGTI